MDWRAAISVLMIWSLLGGMIKPYLRPGPPPRPEELMTFTRGEKKLALISLMIAVPIGIVVLAMLIGIFGVFLYDQGVSTVKSAFSAVGNLKGGLKKP